MVDGRRMRMKKEAGYMRCVHGGGSSSSSSGRWDFMAGLLTFFAFLLQTNLL